jgi:thioester reductase-like protein
VILLTGATGFVGRFLLNQLLQDTDAKIYCVVRADSMHHALERLRSVLIEWDLWSVSYESRILAVPGDLRLPHLGIDHATFDLLCREADSIYHCATSMNHLETYAMAKAANVDSAAEILRLATTHKQKIVNYISTLSIFSPSEHVVSRLINERTPIDSEIHSASSGYTASKWVADKIIMMAIERGIPCRIFRLGLVWADTLLGRYDEAQRVYRVAKSALISSYGIRNYRTDMALTPVDYVARSIVSLAECNPSDHGIFHISCAEQGIDGIFECCNDVLGTSLELVPYYEWVLKMRDLHHRGIVLPAMPLIEFAFSMDKESFHEWQQAKRSSAFSFELSTTHAQLERGGVFAPILNKELVARCVQCMVSRDVDLRDLRDKIGTLVIASDRNSDAARSHGVGHALAGGVRER